MRQTKKEALNKSRVRLQEKALIMMARTGEAKPHTAIIMHEDKYGNKEIIMEKFFFKVQEPTPRAERKQLPQIEIHKSYY